MKWETQIKWFLSLWKVKWLRKWLLQLVINKLPKEENIIMALTPNVGVSEIEVLAFSVGDLLYATKLRALLEKAIDSPDKMYDDRLLAACDGAFAFKGE